MKSAIVSGDARRMGAADVVGLYFEPLSNAVAGDEKSDIHSVHRLNQVFPVSLWRARKQ